MIEITIAHWLIGIITFFILIWFTNRITDFFIVRWPGKDFRKYKIILKGRFFAIRLIGKYRRDLETSNWHYYEDYCGRIWHFRKENIAGVFGDSAETVLKNRLKVNKEIDLI